MARKIGSHSSKTGPKVRAAALRLMYRHGFAAVSMRQIAAEVGVQAGALYTYTPDKESLLFDLLHDHMTELLDAVAEEPVSTGDPAARLDALTRFHIRFHVPRTEVVFLSYMELRNLSAENFERIDRQRQAYEAIFEAALRDGVAAGQMRVPDPKVTSVALIAMLNGISNWYRPDGRLSLDEIEAIYLGMVRGAVGLATT